MDSVEKALFYYSIAYFLMPKTREEVPFKQMGYDLDQFILFFAEIGLYEASVFELYKGLVCIFDQDYGYSKMYCSAPAAIASEEDDEDAGAEKLDDRKQSDKTKDSSAQQLFSGQFLW